MSAPATNPLRFAERRTRPRGFACEISASAAASSLRTAADRTLVDVPGVSQVSHAIRSASTSNFQAAGLHGLQAAARRDSRMVKSQISGKWSDNWMSGISNRFTSISRLCRMKSSSLRGLELG